ncbi:unnamed protein product [Trichobilharzia regenti]|nr:unnamed protein product [Trichobilharzia regenti]
MYYPLDDSDITMHLQRKSINNDITDDVNLDQPHTSVSADRSINSKLSGVHVTDPILLNKSLLSSSPVPSIESTSEHAGTYRYPTLTEFQLTSHVLFRLEIIQPCISWCTQVETVCPYLNPADSTSNGGEPAFLCDGRCIIFLIIIIVIIVKQLFLL